MSKGVDRDQVLQTMRVRTALKNDGSWIHKSKQEKEETENAVETRPIPVKKKSYVFSAANKFDQTEINVETSTVTEPENATYLDQAGAKPQPSKESCKTLSPKQVAAETVEAEAKDVVDSLPETPAINNATPGEKATLQHSMEQDPDIVSKPSTQSAAETAVKSAESKVKSAAIAEPTAKTGAEEEIAECEAQPTENAVVNQSMDSVPESAANCVMGLSDEDAVEPVTASEVEAVQDKLSDRVIELTDALDMVPPTAETVLEPVNDPEQSKSEKSKMNQSDDTNNTEQLQKPSEELQSKHTLRKTRNGKAVCSFCDQIMDGNVKITISEPQLTCHDECLKCGVCAKALGDLLTPMFLHHQVIHCNRCFVKALKT